MLCYAMLSHFSRVRLCATPQMAAHQAPPSLGFSRQEHWSGLPFPSPMHESKKWKWIYLYIKNYCKLKILILSQGAWKFMLTQRIKDDRLFPFLLWVLSLFRNKLSLYVPLGFMLQLMAEKRIWEPERNMRTLSVKNERELQEVW